MKTGSDFWSGPFFCVTPSRVPNGLVHEQRKAAHCRIAFLEFE